MQRNETPEGPVTRVNIGRLTNAIYAFTLLLLFKNIRIPSFSDYLGNETVSQYGTSQVPEIISFVIAFLLIGMFWIVTYHIFHQLKTLDRKFIYIHFAGMMMLIFIPITSHLVEVYLFEPMFAFFFHLNVFLYGLFLWLMWRHASGNRRLLLDEVGAAEASCISVKALYIPATAVIGMVLSTMEVPFTRFLYFGTMIAFLVTHWVQNHASANPCRGDT